MKPVEQYEHPDEKRKNNPPSQSPGPPSPSARAEIGGVFRGRSTGPCSCVGREYALDFHVGWIVRISRCRSARTWISSSESVRTVSPAGEVDVRRNPSATWRIVKLVALDMSRMWPR